MFLYPRSGLISLKQKMGSHPLNKLALTMTPNAGLSYYNHIMCESKIGTFCGPKHRIIRVLLNYS